MSLPQIHIYNTSSRAKEALEPLEPGHVKLYVCGITSYDFCHIGHARSALVFDMVVRHLRHFKQLAREIAVRLSRKADRVKSSEGFCFEMVQYI